MAAEDAELAQVCVRAIRAVDPSLVFITLPYSETMRAAEAAGVSVACEVYADRRYCENGMLAPRQMEGAVIHDVEQSVDQVLSMICNKEIPTIGGTRLPVEAATVCIHGDTPGAAVTARALRDKLAGAGIDIAPFAKPEI
jgi:UPF0271 protein